MSEKKNNQDQPKKQVDFPTVSLGDTSHGDNCSKEHFPKIRNYEIIRKLGEGGISVVYLAKQLTLVRRQVVLKVIKPGMDSRHVIAHFELERQALALLNHPNIATIFDAGSTDEGKSYFVMGYIKGMPITEYCDHHKLSIKERLKLFIPVCEAVQHVHQKGIIHGEIKPSDIVIDIIDGKPVPKIIDFGFATSISMPLTEKIIFIQERQLIRPHEYMSPEQVDLKEKDIDARTDIFSLGVILYELLAGILPLEPITFPEVGHSEMLRIICEQELPRPSTKLSSLGENATKIAEKRQTKLSTLIKILHKELEWIPLMAIRKERDWRYQTASDLAEDVQNYLNGYPLLGGPESVAYKFKKIIQRLLINKMRDHE